METPEKEDQPSFAAAQREALSSAAIDTSGSKPLPTGQMNMVIREPQSPNPRRKVKQFMCSGKFPIRKLDKTRRC